MDYTFLGQSGLRVPALWLGGLNFGAGGRHLGDLDAGAVEALVGEALNHGIVAFDVGNADAGGEAEVLLGKAITPIRNEVIVATKVRLTTGEGLNDFGLSRHHIVREVEQSLQRLGRDHIDLLQAQVWDAWTPIEETLRAFDDLIRAGKVRYVGASNLAGWQLMKALATSERNGIARYVSVQARWNLLEREAERELIPCAADQGVGVLAWSPLAGGMLSGKYAEGEEGSPGQRLYHWPDIRERLDRPRTWEILEVVREIAEEREVPRVQVALNWLRAQEPLAALLVGARTPEQLAQSAGCVEWSLDPEELERLEEAASFAPGYPVDVVARHNGLA